MIHFGYELVRAGDGTLLAEGETTHIVIDKAMNIVAMPGKYIGALRAAAGLAT